MDVKNWILSTTKFYIYGYIDCFFAWSIRNEIDSINNLDIVMTGKGIVSLFFNDEIAYYYETFTDMPADQFFSGAIAEARNDWLSFY